MISGRAADDTIQTGDPINPTINLIVALHILLVVQRVLCGLPDHVDRELTGSGNLGLKALAERLFSRGFAA